MAEEFLVLDSATLRDFATRCRQFAATMRSPSIRDTLFAVANEIEKEASVPPGEDVPRAAPT